MPIEKIAPELDRIVATDVEIKELGTGFGGDAGPAEGPLWWKEDGHLIFSDIGNNRRMKWSASEGVTLLREPTNYANGLTRDPQGWLLACEVYAKLVAMVIQHWGLLTLNIPPVGAVREPPHMHQLKDWGSGRAEVGTC